MYGTVAKLQVTPENRPKVESALADWVSERKASTEGAENEYVFWPDDDGRTGYLVSVFADEERYRRNAESPQQDEWYRRFRSLLETDPEWMDGHFVAPSS